MSRLIYETSLTIDASAKSNVKGSLLTFVRAGWWMQSACGLPVKEKLAVFAVCDAIPEIFEIVSLIHQRLFSIYKGDIPCPITYYTQYHMHIINCESSKF